ncbi:MAG: hypothetical protein M1838_003861 [Thelocarpon superellum]|nr:MAG: hypothetical protein M1838_003861 [Thelocarpon superellum]
MTRLRSRSNGLSGEPRGDTGAPAVSTLKPRMNGSHSPLQDAGAKDRRRPLSRQRRRSRGLFQRWKDLSFRHTWINPLVILLVVLSGYAIDPTPSNPIHHALFLSYALPRPAGADPSTPIQYGKGGYDFAFVAFYIVLLSFTREFLMQIVIRPLAVACGIKGRAKQSRFMEQMYTAMYFAIFGPLGLYVMSRTPVWYFNTTAFFLDFPHRTHEAVFKAYYLLQAAYWAQQAIVLMLMLEKPRKDFKELVLHHIITITLIWCSYRFHFTYMGLAVYITHDISDFFLATSKSLNYVDSIFVGPYFIMFAGIWMYLRHWINWQILWAVATEFRTVGPFELDWDTQQYKCWISQGLCAALLVSLQAVNLFWLYLIAKIAKNYVFANALADERSDGEEEDEEDRKAEGDGEGKDVHPNGHVGGDRDNGSARLKPGESYADAVTMNGTAKGTVTVNGEAKKER